MFKTKLIFALFLVVKSEPGEKSLVIQKDPKFLKFVKIFSKGILDLCKILLQMVKVFYNRIETEFLKTAYETALKLRKTHPNGD